MDDRNDELWRGGPWERNSPTLPPLPRVVIPEAAMGPRRPVLRPRKRRKKWPAFAALAGLIAALCLLAFLGHEITQRRNDRPSGGSTQTQVDESTLPPSIPQAATGTGVTVELRPGGGTPLDYTEIYEKNFSAIVSIQSARANGRRNSGTGVVLTSDGYIVTNAHVVAGAEYVQVTLSNNRYLPASLVGFDADEDLAVLKIDANDLTPAEFGDSDELRCGGPVAALGDPMGYRSTITNGIVSSLDREVEVEGVKMVLIQTSAAINFGNSGGALINQYGQVVGITTIKIVDKEGSTEALGFAIPSQRVKYVVDTLIAGGQSRAGVFGITVDTRPLEGGGLIVQSVDPKSDAHAQGLRGGDLLLAVNGKPVTRTQDLARARLALGVGDSVTLTCRREGETFDLEVKLVDPDVLTK